MKIKYKNIREVLKENNISEFPELGAFISKGNIIKVAQWQPKGMLSFSEQDGFQSIQPQHEEKCRKFLEYAQSCHADIIVTPEYSTPWSLLGQCLDCKEKGPKGGKLWCLGLEGISYDNMESFRDKYQNINHIHLIMEDLDVLNQNAFFSCIAYLFRAERDTVCVLQFKTTADADAWAKFEAGGLTLGHTIYYFADETNRNILFSFICADALNQDVIIGKNQILYQQCLILHPQLNPNPLHDSFNLMRKNFFDYSNVAVRMISINWAKDTVVNCCDGATINTQKSYSAFYCNKPLANMELNKLMTENKPQGIHLAKNDYVYVWYMNDNEHIIMYAIDSFNTNDLNNVTATHKEPLGKEYLEYDNSNSNWIQKSSCDACPIDWDWLKRNFNIDKCNSKDCGVAGIHLFFAIMFCNPQHAALDFEKEQVHCIFYKDSKEFEDIIHLRERSGYIDKQLQSGNVPTKFHKLKDGDYRWVLNEKRNLIYNQEPESENAKDIICVAYVDVANESIIKRKISEFEKLMGKEATDRLILYFFAGESINYYDKIYNKNINNPSLTQSVNTIK